MPYRKVTGMISARHPFHDYYQSDPEADWVRERRAQNVQGFGGAYSTPNVYDFDVSAIDRTYSQILGYGAFDTEKVKSMTKEPVVRALFVGLTAWSLAKLVRAQPNVAKRIGLVSGGMEFIISMGSLWLAKRLEEQKKAQAQQPVV